MTLEDIYRLAMRGHDESVEKGKVAFSKWKDGRHAVYDYDIAFENGRAHAFLEIADAISESIGKIIERK